MSVAFPFRSWESGRERGMPHMAYPEVAVAARKVGYPVDDQPVEDGRVPDLGGVCPGLARVVRLFLFGLTRLPYWLSGGGPSGWAAPRRSRLDHRRRPPCRSACASFTGWQAVLYERGHLADVGGDAPLGDPEKTGNPVLDGAGEPAVGANPALGVGSGEPYELSACGCTFSVSRIKKSIDGAICRRSS